MGASFNVGVYLLPPYVRAYLEEQHARERVELDVDRNAAIAQRLTAGELDVGALEHWTAHAGYVARLWRREELVAIVPPTHPWADLARIPRPLLKGAALLAGEPGTGIRRLLAAHFGDHAPHLRRGMRLGSTEAVKQAVKAGLGIAIVLAAAVTEERRTGRLCAIPLEADAPRLELCIVYRESLGAEAPARRFADWLVARGRPPVG
jgi:DNA-binding transcriptional LysR family regulator